MSLKDLFFIFSKNDYEKDLKIKLASLEMKIEELKESLSAYQHDGSEEKQVKTKEPPIIIEKINIEKIILDKYELNNNFGQLGIKELKGKLNIGATYGSEYIPKLDEEENEETERGDKVKREGADSRTGPKVNIHTKKEEDMKKD